jgi:hypothetical protein
MVLKQCRHTLGTCNGWCISCGRYVGVRGQTHYTKKNYHRLTRGEQRVRRTVYPSQAYTVALPDSSSKDVIVVQYDL